MPTLAEVGVPQQLGVGAVFMSMIRHDGILGTDGVAVNVCHVGGGCDDEVIDFIVLLK